MFIIETGNKYIMSQVKSGHYTGTAMLIHTCGYKSDILCRRCEKPLVYRERSGMFCPACGHEVTIICPGCGKRW
jgi:primosomal protein N'